jgi:AmiR/NasT family two-component response regulator
VRPDTQQLNIPWLGRSGSPPIIPVIVYENPLIIEVLLRLNVYCVIPSPVKSFGVMAALAVTISQSQRTRSREKYVKRLEEKRAVVRSIQKAKMIIMETRGMTEEEAYDVIRAQAMAKREPIERIAEAVLTAHEMYGPIRVG